MVVNAYNILMNAGYYTFHYKKIKPATQLRVNSEIGKDIHAYWDNISDSSDFLWFSNSLKKKHGIASRSSWGQPITRLEFDLARKGMT